MKTPQNFFSPPEYQKTPAYKENLLNEYKGILLEFIVGKKLAIHFHCLNDFQKAIPQYFWQQLEEYEKVLKQMDPLLAKALPLLGEDLTKSILLEYKNSKWNKIYLVGKLASSYDSKIMGEADLILQNNEGESRGLGLKLAKYGSYVNTKSTGVKSFFSKYFGSFDPLGNIQNQFQIFIDEKYAQMSSQLHKFFHLEPKYEFFQGPWKSLGLPELPGQLPKEARHFLFEYYSQITQFLYDQFRRFQTHNPEEFAQALKIFMGISHPYLDQFILFHGGKNSQGQKLYHAQGLEILKEKRILSNLEDSHFQKVCGVKNQFVIKCPEWDLQIRPKPMNKFTTQSLKINFSLKFKSFKQNDTKNV